jgi:DNA helicase II / ATP-dependent DNA helicase PcrA
MTLFSRNYRKAIEPIDQSLPTRHKVVSNEAQDELNNKEALLNDFLAGIKPTEEWDAGQFESSSLDLQKIDAGEYPELATTPQLDARVEQLRKVTKDIDKYLISSDVASAIDFSGFRIFYPGTLNKAQLAAVCATNFPLLVIAGAGSGKTRVIVHRVAYLIESGVDPQSILLLTFTRKAANEMLNRVQTLLQSKKAANIMGGTFHSFANFILRKYARMLGLPHNFTVIDTADAEDIIDLIRTELRYNTKGKKFPQKGRIHNIISYARNRQVSIRKVIEDEYSGLTEFVADIELIFKGYMRYNELSRCFDFDDLMEVLCTALSEHAPFLKAVQQQYQYVLVDEFQDTNAIQNEIVQLIGSGHQRVMVVGDDAQSIYGFRGANYENILRFPEVFPKCKVVKLEENYRSSQAVLNFTNAVIDHSVIGFGKRLFSNNVSKALPVVKRTYDQFEEAVFIADRIVELIEQGVSMDEIAILNRADWHNRYIQTELSKRGLPYVVVGGFKFSERMHVKDIVAYLRLSYNPSDAVSWHRVLKYIGGVGRVTASKMIENLQNTTEPFSFELFRQRKFYDELMELGTMLKSASRAEVSIHEKVNIIRAYYTPRLKARESDYLQRMQDIEVLHDLSKKYTNLDRFISDFALDPPTRRVADQSTPLIDESEDDGKITISTIHSAKGLEWFAVFIPHALEGLLPSNRANQIEDMEEERRLFYVACSRAKEDLYITFPRHLHSYEAFFHLPSRFLIEIDNACYRYSDVE